MRRVRAAVLVDDRLLERQRQDAGDRPALLARDVNRHAIAQMGQQVAKPGKRLRRQAVPPPRHPQQPVETCEQPLRRSRFVGQPFPLGAANCPLRAGVMESAEDLSLSGRRSSRCKQYSSPGSAHPRRRPRSAGADYRGWTQFHRGRAAVAAVVEQVPQACSDKSSGVVHQRIAMIRERQRHQPARRPSLDAAHHHPVLECRSLSTSSRRMARSRRSAAARSASQASERRRPRDAGPAARTSADLRSGRPRSAQSWLEAESGRRGHVRRNAVHLIDETIVLERGVGHSRAVAVRAFDSPSITGLESASSAGGFATTG